MPEEQDDQNQPRKTFFDVARPGTTPSSATSRPLVVGHGVSQSDPMMRKRHLTGKGAIIFGIAVLACKAEFTPVYLQT